MLLCFQVLGCCLLFFLLVRCAVKNDGLNCIYFYPQAYIDEAQKRGLTEKDTAMKKGETLHPRPLPFSFDRPDLLSGTV